MSASDLTQALTAPAILEDRIAVERECRAADGAAFELGSPHAGANALDDQAALKLGDGADDDDEGAAHRTAGVDLFSTADELDSQVV